MALDLWKFAATMITKKPYKNERKKKLYLYSLRRLETLAKTNMFNATLLVCDCIIIFFFSSTHHHWAITSVLVVCLFDPTNGNSGLDLILLNFFNK